MRRVRRRCAGGAMMVLVAMALAPASATAQRTGTPSRALSQALDTVMFGMRSVFDPDLSLDGADQQLVDVTRAAWLGDAARWRRVQRRLQALPTAALTPVERTTRRVLLWRAGLQAARGPFWWYDFSGITPYASPIGGIARQFAGRRLASAADTGSYLRLLRDVGPLVDSIRAGLEQRAARGIRLSRHALPASTALARTYTAAGDANPFAVPSERLAALDPPTATAFSSAASRIVSESIVPAATRLVALLDGPYAAAAPDAVGVSSYAGGRAYYDWLVQWHTTLPVRAEAVHRIGLAEVARIEREMAAIRQQLGFTGTRAEFHAQLARDPRFFAKTPEEMGARLMQYSERLRAQLPRAFSLFPKAQGDVRRLPEALEPAMTFGYYQVPTPTDSMGHYYYNGSKLDQRSLLTAAPIIAHELMPGHHLQVNVMLENTALPAYRRNSGYTAFSEGWGDYASIVAGELGLYADPYDRYGRLAMDMFISCRLVVDTGMNGLGWSLERGRQFMRDHVLESEAQILTESLRYSTDLPGQALAYKMGSREFVRLRSEAERALGVRFDLKAFHAMVVGSGMLPMGVLGDEVTAWIASQRTMQ